MKKLFNLKRVNQVVANAKAGNYKKNTQTISNLNPSYVKNKLTGNSNEPMKRDLSPFQQKKKNPWITENSFPVSGFEIIIESVFDESENKIVWARVKDVKLIDKTFKNKSREDIIAIANSIYTEMLRVMDIEEMRTGLREFITQILRKTR